MSVALFLLPSSGEEWKDWLIDDAPKLAGVLLALILLKVLSQTLLGRLLRGAAHSTARVSREDPLQVERRARTLESTLSWLLTIAAAFIGVAVVLDTVGVDVAPLIAGVGVVGIALGLGAQTLIKDVLTGVFILFEDQFGVGDQVTIAGVSGEVVAINPRRTVVRDAEGNTHSIPNGTITTATNRTASLGRVVVDVRVRFGDVEAASAVIESVAAEIAAEGVGAGQAPLRIAARTVVNDGDVLLTVAGTASPAARWAIEGELRSRLRARLEEARLEAAFPAEQA